MYQRRYYHVQSNPAKIAIKSIQPPTLQDYRRVVRVGEMAVVGCLAVGGFLFNQCFNCMVMSMESKVISKVINTVFKIKSNALVLRTALNYHSPNIFLQQNIWDIWNLSKYRQSRDRNPQYWGLTVSY